MKEFSQISIKPDFKNLPFAKLVTELGSALKSYLVAGKSIRFVSEQLLPFELGLIALKSFVIFVL